MTYNKDKLESFISRSKTTERSFFKANKIPVYNVNRGFIDRKFLDAILQQNEFYMVRVSADEFMFMSKMHIINIADLEDAETDLKNDILFIGSKVENIMFKTQREKIEIIIDLFDELSKVISNTELLKTYTKLFTRHRDKIIVECNNTNNEPCDICNYIVMFKTILRNPDLINQNVINLFQASEEDIENFILNHDKYFSLIDIIKINVIMIVLEYLYDKLTTLYKYCFYFVNDRNKFILCFDKYYFDTFAEKVIKEMSNHGIASINDIEECIKVLFIYNEDKKELDFDLHILLDEKCEKYDKERNDLLIKKSIIKSNRRHISIDEIYDFYEAFNKYMEKITSLLFDIIDI